MTRKIIGGKDCAKTLAARAIQGLCGGKDALEFEELAPQTKKNLSPTESFPVLLEGDEVLAHGDMAICQLLAQGSALEPADAFGKAAVYQWMDYNVEILQVLVGAASALAKPLKGVNKKDAQQGQEIGYVELGSELTNNLEKYLANKTYLVGEKLSIADIIIAATLVFPLSSIIEPKAARKLVNFTRWFNSVRTEAKFDDFLPKPFAMFIGKAAVKKQQLQELKRKKKEEEKILQNLSSIYSDVPTNQVIQPKLQTLFRRSRIRVKDILFLENEGEELIGQTIIACGWIKTIREAQKGAIAFIELNDGSCLASLQVICDAKETVGFESLMQCGGVGASAKFIGEVVKSPAKGQKVELKAKLVEVLGKVDKDSYPLKKTGKGAAAQSKEKLREIAHLRPRTNLISAVARVRNACSHAVHQFFNERGFLYVHTPLITSSDCEGAGEMFSVTSLLGKAKGGKLPVVDKKSVQELKKDPNFHGPMPKVGDINYKEDFFGKPAFLTVSGQLNVETYACALSDVYTFGPTFRAENSFTSRHLCEFWMIEPELCFATLEDDINLAEDFVKYLASYVLSNCKSDIEFFDERVEKGLVKRLENVIENEFKRLTYTEAIDLLKQPKHLMKDGKPRFEEQPEWGIDLGSEHERYLAEVVYQKPVVLTDYPADIKAFYMKQNDLDKEGRLTVQAADVLVPRIGELVGGSAREDDFEKLEQRIHDMGLEPEHFEWYLDLRRYGSVPHAGFGLGFERLIMFVTGIENIRDVIPYPRWPKHCQF